MNDNPVSLKEYFDLKITDLKETFLKAEESNSTALKLQANETERRLEALNGEAARTTKILESTIPREVHERDIKELRNLIDVLTLAGQKWVTQDYLAGVLKEPNANIRTLTSSQDFQSGKASQQAVNIALFISIFGLIIGIVSIIIKFIK